MVVQRCENCFYGTGLRTGWIDIFDAQQPLTILFASFQETRYGGQ
jgi:hypothetical protein